MGIKVPKLIRQNVGVRDEVKVLPAESLLHPNHVEAEPVFAGDLVALRKVIDFLVLVESFVEVRLTARRAPENVPLMRLSVGKVVSLIE